MKVVLRNPWALRLSAWILGGFFLAAAYPKLADPPGFAEALQGYALLPAAALAPLALLLPWVEALAGLALLTGIARRSAALLALALLLVFTGALTLNLARRHPVDCGCFGASRQPKTPDERLRAMRWDLARDLALVLLALHGVLGRKEPAP